MNNDEIETTIREIAHLLEAGHSEVHAQWVRDAIQGTPQNLDEFLTSNELWGGSGSIADSAFVGRSEQRKRLEQLLIRVGRLQIKTGKVNNRTEMWVTAFENWHAQGI